VFRSPDLSVGYWLYCYLFYLCLICRLRSLSFQFLRCVVHWSLFLSMCPRYVINYVSVAVTGFPWIPLWCVLSHSFMWRCQFWYMDIGKITSFLPSPLDTVTKKIIGYFQSVESFRFFENPLKCRLRLSFVQAACAINSCLPPHCGNPATVHPAWRMYGLISFCAFQVHTQQHTWNYSGSDVFTAADSHLYDMWRRVVWYALTLQICSCTDHSIFH
jgi:hypothetical protein